jgi:pyruvate carboxylase
VRVPKAGLGAVRSKPKAEEGNIKHVGAPMPGMVVTLAIKVGQSVKKGDPLLSIEAMKMETMLTAERDATVHAIHVRSGETINAKDLLIELS